MSLGAICHCHANSAFAIVSQCRGKTKKQFCCNIHSPFDPLPHYIARNLPEPSRILKGPIHDSDFQPPPRSAAGSRLRLAIYPHTPQQICLIFLSWIAVLCCKYQKILISPYKYQKILIDSNRYLQIAFVVGMLEPIHGKFCRGCGLKSR